MWHMGEGEAVLSLKEGLIDVHVHILQVLGQTHPSVCLWAADEVLL